MCWQCNVAFFFSDHRPQTFVWTPAQTKDRLIQAYLQLVLTQAVLYAKANFETTRLREASH